MHNNILLSDIGKLLQSAVALTLASALLFHLALAATPQAKHGDAAHGLLPVGQDFEFIDNEGRLRRVSGIAPDIAVVFFGYSNCPDICSGILAKLATAKKLLGSDSKRVQVLFVTVDPKRDTRQALNSYLSLFGSDFIGARLPLDELPDLADSFAVYYRRIDENPNYLVSHSSGVFLFDSSGRPARYLAESSTYEEMKEALSQLLG